MRAQRGFTYMGLVVFVAIVGLVGAAAIKAESLLRRAAAEEELLRIGAEFSDALKSYELATPRGQPSQPRKLEELLRDTRFPGIKRHLRKIYVDPMTGKAEWGFLFLDQQGGITGVFSLSNGHPFKVANFPERFGGFNNASSYRDWKFTAAGGIGEAVPVTPQPPPNIVPPMEPPQPDQGSVPAPAPAETPAPPAEPPQTGDKPPPDPNAPRPPGKQRL